jgi:predicted O-methyltransferase YrrM
VDLFSSKPGKDWGEEKRSLTWEEFCGMPSPEMEKAKNNLTVLELFENVKLIKSKDSDFLKKTKEKFDFIYLDTSHDYETVKISIDLSRNCLNENGVIGGDDFSDSGTWGVASAVKESFENFTQHGVCWLSSYSNYKKVSV